MYNVIKNGILGISSDKSNNTMIMMIFLIFNITNIITLSLYLYWSENKKKEQRHFLMIFEEIQISTVQSKNTIS